MIQTNCIRICPFKEGMPVDKESRDTALLETAIGYEIYISNLEWRRSGHQENFKTKAQSDVRTKWIVGIVAFGCFGSEVTVCSVISDLNFAIHESLKCLQLSNG